MSTYFVYLFTARNLTNRGKLSFRLIRKLLKQWDTMRLYD